MPSRFDAIDVERLRRRRTVKWSLYGADVLAAWVAEMDFDVAPVVRAALLDAVEREDFGYVAADLTELTSACAAFLATRFGWDVSTARIFPVADVLTGISGALDSFVPPASRVVVPTPAYPPFFEVIELTGREVVAVPMRRTDGRDALDLDALDAALADGATAVLLCNPHNPTGRVFSAGELDELAAIVDRYNARVIADEVHAPLVYPGSTHVPYATRSDATAAHTITVTSASKAFNLAGL
jgi:cystathionine beta-lyase